MADTNPSPPKVFISYSWTSPEYAESVRELADRLIADGIEVKIDRYDLKPGHDANAFMEAMVTDSSITRVLVICDKVYAEKANARRGGVGTESQIISDEVYKKTNQEKFIPVIREMDEQGNAYVPVFLKGRLYINMSSVAREAENYEQLVRAIYGRPAKQKPSLGKTPSYLLADTTIQTQTHPSLRTLKDAIQQSRPHAQIQISDYLTRFCDSLEDARISFTNEEPIDEQILAGIRSLLPHRDEFMEFVTFVADYADNPDTHREVFEFFQSATRYLNAPPDVRSWREEEFDYYRFFLYETFLYAIAILIKKRRLAFAVTLLDREYYTESLGKAPQFQSFSLFRPYLISLDEARNRRINARRVSITADLLKDRATSNTISLDELMETEFILFLRSILKKSEHFRWHPLTLVHANEFKTFRLFSLAESSQYFADLKVLLGVKTKQELLETYKTSVAHQRLSDSISFDSGIHSLSIPRLGNFEKLDTRP